MKKLLIGKIIGIIGICLLAMGISYTITYYYDKVNYKNTNVLVTFEDTKEFTIPSKKLDKENVLKTYPYIFKVENKESSKVNYQIKINTSLKDLNYVLYLDDKEIKDGNIENLDNNILYENTIFGKKESLYKLYVYSNKDLEDDVTYSIEVISK